jgi:lipoprotein NlpI
MDDYLSLTLSQLGYAWAGPRPEKGDSYVVRRSYELKTTKLSDLTVEDLRFLISQNEGLEYTIPLALNILQVDLMAEGDFYPGDLLKSVLSVKPSYWHGNSEQKQGLIQLYKANRHRIAMESITQEIKNDIETCYSMFSDDQ